MKNVKSPSCLYSELKIHGERFEWHKREPQSMVASGPTQKAPLSRSFDSCFHPQIVFDHT